MVIDKGKLVALLAEKTGRSIEETEEWVGELLARIEAVRTSGEAFTIEGFGVFERREDRLHFEPADRLKTEINQKYAGMKPIELMEAFKKTGAGVPVEEVPEAAPPQEPPATASGMEPGHETPGTIAGKETERASAGEAESEPPDAASAADADSEEAAPAEEPAPKAKKGAPRASRRARAAYGTDRGSGAAGKMLVAALLAIAILVTGWILYDQGTFGGSGVDDTEPASPADTIGMARERAPAGETAADSAMSPGRADSMEQNSLNTVSGNSTAADDTASASLYGLRGTTRAELENAYTIVIHSFRLQSTVQQIADSLSSVGYRTVLSQREVSGETRWRLGLGQFESWQDALQAAEALPEPYASDHFIDQI